MIEAKSKAMVQKELVLAVAAYNLTRATMNQAASALQCNPRELSNSLAQDTIQAFLPAFANATTEPQREQLMQEMLRVFKYSKLPDRSNRSPYERAIWPRGRSFPHRKLAKKCKSTGERNVTNKKYLSGIEHSDAFRLPADPRPELALTPSETPQHLGYN